MLVKSTSGSSIPTARRWAAVAATCLATTSAHADYQSARRPTGEQLRFATRSTTLGVLPPQSDFVVYADSAVLNRSPSTRETTEQERTIATLRSWERHEANWDGEGAKLPSVVSLRAASAFVCAIDRDALMPEAMLHDNGRAGLFWESADFYADLEFLESGAIAYYIERGNDRHKGVVAFDGRKVPRFFGPLLES